MGNPMYDFLRSSQGPDWPTRGDATLERVQVPDLPLICVIDDDRSVRSATARLAQSLGYEVRVFDSAETYLTATVADPHILVCDVQMPGMSGIDLYEKLQAEGRKVPTVFVTAHDPAAAQQRAGPGTRILGKPFNGSDLARCIEDMRLSL